MESITSKKQRRGFAAMSPDRQREIASLGGLAAHRSGNAHEFTPEEAQRASRRRHPRTQDTQQRPSA
jgi:uncharacterized protein